MSDNELTPAAQAEFQTVAEIIEKHWETETHAHALAALRLYVSDDWADWEFKREFDEAVSAMIQAMGRRDRAADALAVVQLVNRLRRDGKL